MNVGEKVCLYKEKLNHRHFADFARAANCSVSWLNDISKKEEIKAVADMGNLVNLCAYLGVGIDDFLRNDEPSKEEIIENIDLNSEDIGILLNNMIYLLGREGIKMDNVVMNDKSREVCKDSLNVVKTLVRQHL